MKILADENITLVHEFFDHLGEVETCPGRSMTADLVAQADILLVRSVTQVNEALVKDSKISFVGTCTIGTDHIDQEYLNRKGIGFSSAPGCNANAVVDYVLCAIASLGLDRGISLKGRRLGIVGLGNVGSRLRQRMEAAGVECLCSDPPLQRRGVEGLLPLEEVLKGSDIISLHTPLTKVGPDATYHLLDSENLPLLNRGSVLINTSRGAVVDNQALSRFLDERSDVSAVLDVWEPEPDIDISLLNKVAVATPHIAGYSLEGKIKGTAMIYQSVCNHFGIQQQRSLDGLLPPEHQINFEPGADNLENTTFQVLKRCYDITEDDRMLRAIAIEGSDDFAVGFDRLRKQYPVRRELEMNRIVGIRVDPKLTQRLGDFGVRYC